MIAQSQTIGPYTLEKRLGAGGMGEVYQAYDRRLERSVAIKLIRPEHMEKETARERFRREARAAARLSHPSIVQIYDIVESEESDAIVLELVEGEPLSRRIARGRLPVEEAVRLGRQIAEGLAAAHARGILHRDLKPENVMVTPESRAKILDFGLAKRLEGEASLTEDHRVIGTFRSMSPEQARGLPLDHRSDLFSFGTLLYEMLSGRSPFDGGSTLETLTRICTCRQTPLRELVPGIPQAISDLVDHLLEKDPGLRPGSALEAARSLEEAGGASTQAWSEIAPTLVDRPAAVNVEEPSSTASTISGRRPVLIALITGLVLLAGLGWWLLHFSRPSPPRPATPRPVPLRPAPLYVAVPRPELAGVRGAGVNVLATSLRSSLIDGLLAFEGVWPLAAEQVDAVAGSPRDLARAMAATEVAAAQLNCDASTCQVTLNRVRGGDGAVLWTRSFAAPVEQPYLLTEAVRGYLRKAYPERSLKPGVSRAEVRAEDYAEYLKLFESFDTLREEEYSIDTILERLSAIRQSSPNFLDTFIFEAYMLQHRFRSGRDRKDLTRAYGALDQARRLAPEDPRPLLSLFEVAFLGEDLDRAEAALRELERLQPGDARLLAQRARLIDRRGEPEQALSLMLEAVRRLPAWRHLFWAADMAFRQGKIDSARGHLHELLRRSPGNLTGLSLLAQLELANGEPRWAAALYEELVRRSPQLGYWVNLGLAHMLMGDLERAEQSFRAAWQKQPKNPFVVLNLADACQLLGRTREAADLYNSTLRLAAEDPTADSSWQIFSTRAQALAHLGRSDEAVAAIQGALRLAPANPQVAYEASLVYTLLGDRASALFNARKALAQGIAPKWFELPWFAPLRQDILAALSSKPANREG